MKHTENGVLFRWPCPKVDLLYFLLLLAVSNYGSGSHIYFFWQKSPVEYLRLAVGRGGPSTFFGVFASVCTGILYCVLLARNQGPGQTHAIKTKRK